MMYSASILGLVAFSTLCCFCFATTKFDNVKQFFDNEADNLRLMHSQGWIDENELEDMLDVVRRKLCRDDPESCSGQGNTTNTAVDVWPLEQIECSIGRYTALTCSGQSRLAPLATYRTEKQMCGVWNSMCNSTRLKLLQIAIPKAASTSLDNVIRKSPLVDPCYVSLCCKDGTIMNQVDYDNSPKHEVQYMTNRDQLKTKLGVQCHAHPGECESQWSLSTKYQQPCNYVSAHSSYHDAIFAMERGVANVQVVTMLREPVARIRSAYLYTAKTNWGSGKHKLGTHAHPPDMDIVDFMEMNTLYAGNNLQTRLIAGTKSHHRNQTATESTLDRAKRNLADFAYFGIAERFDESVCLLRHSDFGHNVLRINENWHNDPMTRANVRSSMYQRMGLEITQDQLDKARSSSLLQYDLKLYDYALDLFERRLQQYPQCLKSGAEQTTHSTHSQPSSEPDDGQAEPQRKRKKKKKRKRRAQSPESERHSQGEL